MADSPKVPLKNSPTATNWVEKYGALAGKTNWIRRVAEHLKGKGMPDGIAIATAVNAAQKMCESGDTNLPGVQQVNPGSRAEACAAYAKWKAAKGKAKAARATNMTARRASDAFRQVDLARSYLLVKSGDKSRMTQGSVSAYLDLATSFDESKHPRDELGRWIALAAAIAKLKPGVDKKVSRAFHVKRLEGDKFRVTMMKGHAKESRVRADSPIEAASVVLHHSLNDKKRLVAKLRAQVPGL